MSPATVEAIPPENCCTEALTDMKAPRSGRSGTAEISALAEIMRQVIAMNSTDVDDDAPGASGVTPRLQ